MTKEERALEYLNEFLKCDLNEKSKPALGEGMGFVLMHLEEGKSITAKELSKAMGVSMARITAIIKSMEDKGYVERKTSDMDARVSYIYLSDSGMERKKFLMNKATGIIMDIMDEVGEEEINHFLYTAGKIRGVLDKDFALMG